jgi:hypothetical protein
MTETYPTTKKNCKQKLKKKEHVMIITNHPIRTKIEKYSLTFRSEKIPTDFVCR